MGKKSETDEREEKENEDLKRQYRQLFDYFYDDFVRNKYEHKKSVFPLLTAYDIVKKEERSCELCKLHGPGTPCFRELSRWKKCTLKDTEDVKCKEMFENEFYPCTLGLEKYYLMRATLFFADTKDMMKCWFHNQKLKSSEYVYRKISTSKDNQ